MYRECRHLRSINITDQQTIRVAHEVSDKLNRYDEAVFNVVGIYA
ncbi:hypothetical protein [Xenorhabdus sp. Sc-CR9]|nr:hypothetical protein [Xenorhabdus sp. Sc-CR9]